MEDKGGGDENQNDVDEDDDTLAQDVGGEAVEPATNDATVVPDGGDAGKPYYHEKTGDINRNSDTIIVGAENFNGEINEESGDKIGRKAENV